MYQFNPYIQPVQRLQQLEAQYPQFQQSYPQYPQNYPQQAQLLKGNPVTSIDEARASRIDLDGSLFIFPDVTNKKIYTKQINLDGTASLITYIQEPCSGEQEQPLNQFLSKDDIISLENKIMVLNENMEQIKKELIINAKPDANVTISKPNKKQSDV